MALSNQNKKLPTIGIYHRSAANEPATYLDKFIIARYIHTLPDIANTILVIFTKLAITNTAADIHTILFPLCPSSSYYTQIYNLDPDIFVGCVDLPKQTSFSKSKCYSLRCLALHGIYWLDPDDYVCVVTYSLKLCHNLAIGGAYVVHNDGGMISNYVYQR